MKNNSLLTAVYFLLFTLWGLSYKVVIPVPISLVIMATSIVYIGCHRSINLLLSEEEGGIAAAERETLSAADAYKFPFIGSAALFGLYAAFKFFDKDTVNIILAIYFSLAGVYTLTSSFSKFASLFITSTKRFGVKFSVYFLGEIDARLTPAEILCLILAIIFSGVYVKTKHFMMNNILGISFCIQSIEKISVGSYKIGGILLIGLFFYDIFWVFGTDVMVTVAKSFDGPIKLLFPRVLADAAAGIKGEFSLLGLGDIVVPGLFVSLLLRFDTVRARVPAINAEYMSFSKPYFNVNIICYALGLCCTVGVMYFFNAAQPALLYLVPACLGGSLAVALARQELDVLFAYDEAAKTVEAKAEAVAKKEE